MEYKDYYKILGVARDAAQDEIKKSYRKLARKYHPDVSKEADAEDKFKEVNEAYEALKDPEKRAAYDQLGENLKAGQEFTPPPDWKNDFEFRSGGAAGADGEHFSDFFENIFGHGDFAQSASSRERYRQPAADSHAKVKLNLEDAYKGASCTIGLQDAVLGADGRPQGKSRTLKVKIPKGAYQGQHIRLAKQGSKGLGSNEGGDLYIEIDFNPHSIYRVETKNVFLDLPISPWEAALGAKVPVPTPSGSVELTIPANTPTGRKFRLQGRGIPAKVPGDLFVVVNIVMPKVNTEQEKAAFKALAESFNVNPRAKLGV